MLTKILSAVVDVLKATPSFNYGADWAIDKRTVAYTDFILSTIYHLPKCKEIVDIGTGPGLSALSMAYKFPAKIVSSFDIRQQCVENGINLAKKFNLNNVKFIKGISEDFKKYFTYIDFCFVDGNHTKNGCLKDLDFTAPFISEGGIILCHDYENKQDNPVNQAILEFLEKNESWIAVPLYTFCIISKKIK